MRSQRDARTDVRHEYVPLATLDESVEEKSTLDAAEPADLENPAARTPLRRYLRLLTAFFSGNAGLLLIALSQGFASLMGVFVKKLNEVDPPVHPLEVGPNEAIGRC